MAGLIEAVTTLAKLKGVGDSIVAAEITAPQLLNLAAQYGVAIDSSTAEAMASLIPGFIEDASDTMTKFVTDGGLLRMLAAQLNGSGQQSSVGRCQHCNNLVFF